MFTPEKFNISNSFTVNVKHIRGLSNSYFI